MQHQTRIAVFVHPTWGTWDRLPLLVGEIERGVHRALSSECERLKVEVLAIGGVEDHVHLLLRLPATLSLSELLKQMKGTSAHLITRWIAPSEFFKWQGGYAAFSVSPRHLRQVADYIANQRHHHLANTLLPSLKPDADVLMPESFQSA
jgi:putative transposase